MRWASLAGSQGAIIACSFWEVMQATNAMKAPAIWANADMAERGRGIKLFGQQFPQIAAIRKSAAHPGELSATAAEWAKHSIKGSFEAFGIAAVDGTDAFIQGTMYVEGSKMTYGSSFRGKPVSYELSEESAQVLESVAGSYLITFLPLEGEKARQAREWHAKIDGEQLRGQSSRPRSFLLPVQPLPQQARGGPLLLKTCKAALKAASALRRWRLQ
jgi:hypothetical protein